METMITEIASSARLAAHPASIAVGLGAGAALMSGAAGRAVLKAQDLFTPRVNESDIKEG